MAAVAPPPAGGAPPSRPPRPANLTVPNMMNASLHRQHKGGGAGGRGVDATSEQEKLLAASGISFNRTERATKFTYSTETGQWTMESIRIRIATEYFSEGGMRRSYRAAQIEANGDGITNLVVKLFKDPKTKPSVIFHEALTQAVAEKYAVGFNNLCERKAIMLRIKFLPVWVLHLTERSVNVDHQVHDTYATLEPFLPGNYVKLSDNSGRHLNDIPAQAGQSFSHYTFLASGRRLVCVDIQGVSELSATDDDAKVTAKTLTLTDPQIHSLDGNMFGAGNLGINGINAFISSYKRTMFDEQLGLAHLGPAMLVTSKAAAHAQPSLPPVSEAPPFDTAELASRLSEDEREEREEDGDEVANLEPPVKSLDELLLSPKVGGGGGGVGRTGSVVDHHHQSGRERFSSRIQHFSVGGDIHRLSMVARSYAAISLTDEQIRDVV